MKNKIIYLFAVLFLVSCGSSNTSSLAPDSSTVASSPKVTAQSILSNMEKGKYKEGEVLVKFKSGILTSASLKTHQAIGATSLKRYTIVQNLERVKLPAGLSVKDAIANYMSDPAVEYAEPNFARCLSSFMPNDSDFFQQWALHNTGQFASGTLGADIRAPQAWDWIRGSNNVTVAVLDSGIDFSHPDFTGAAGSNIWSNPGESCSDGIDHDGNGFINDCRGWNFVDNTNDPSDDLGHGTHVAGIIGAVGNNNLGIAGVMWTVKLMPLKIFNADSILTGSCSSVFASDEIAAIQYAVLKGAKIINASFHSEGFCNSEFNAISAANTAGVLFVASAGNGGLDSMGNNNDVDPQYPASYNLPNIISVAATDQNDRLASFSNFGPNSVHVAAPGVYILSTVPFAGVQSSFQSFCTGSQFAGYDFCAGTSMAAPHVSGLAGLLYSYYTNFTMNQVRGTIFRYVDLLPSLNGKVKQNGRIDAEQAVTALLTPTNLVATAQSSSQTNLTWTDNATGEDGYDVDRMAPGGSFVRIATLGPNATTFSDSGLTASTAYTYRVRAFNGVPAVSFYSNEASATTSASGAPPASDPPSSGGGGGGCSIGARQNIPTAMIDLGMLLMPLLIFAILRRRT